MRLLAYFGKRVHGILYRTLRRYINTVLLLLLLLLLLLWTQCACVNTRTSTAQRLLLAGSHRIACVDHAQPATPTTDNLASPTFVVLVIAYIDS